MLRFIALSKAAKSGNDDLGWGIAGIFILVIVLLAGILFLGMPIMFIVGSCMLITEGFTENVQCLLGGGLLGILIAYPVGLTLIAYSIEDKFFPYPSEYTRKRYYTRYETEMKAHKKGMIRLTLIMCAITLVVVGIAVIGITCAANIAVSGIAFLIFGILGMTSIILGILAKIFWG
ncbi:MAG: hypothetical protein E7314_00240 [Clostridiales bacterium]|nr:hypothetical protein [Clostridiales bacterium]